MTWLWAWTVVATWAGEPVFMDTPGPPIASGDVNGDGLDDLVFLLIDDLTVRLGEPAGLATADHFELRGGPLLEPFTDGTQVADVNADGFDDLVLCSLLGEQVVLFLGGPAGLPATPSQVVEDAEASVYRVDLLVVPDMTGDGFPDVVLADQASVKRITGTATGLDPEWERSTYAVDAGTPSMSTGDVNGDGLADVMLSHLFERPAHLLLGGPPLADAVADAQVWDFDVAFNGLPAVVADLTGDGLDDALVSDALGVLRILPGTPSGLDPAWDPATATVLDLPPADLVDPRGSSQVIGYAVARSHDADGDGTVDLLLSFREGNDGEANEGIVALYPGLPGAISPAPTWWVTGNAPGAALELMAVADSDGDGADELWLERRADTLMIPVGATGFPASFPLPGAAEERVEDRFFGFEILGADVDGDGFSDVLSTAFKPRPPIPLGPADGGDEGEVTLWPGGPSGTLPTVPSQRWTSTGGFGRQLTVLGDLDGDGLPDVMAAGADAYGPSTYGYYYYGADFLWSGGSVLFGASGTQLDLRSTSFVGFAKQAAPVGDLDGDGLPDLVMTTDAQGLALWFAQPGGTYAAMPDQVFLSDRTLRWTADLLAPVGDVDGDGLQDLAVGMIRDTLFADPVDGGVRVYFGNPAGIVAAFQEVVPPARNTTFGIAVDAAGDVNDDGYDDVWVGTLTDGAHLFFGGPAGLSAAPDWSVPPLEAGRHGYQVRAAGDVNGDGFEDALARPIDYLDRVGEEFFTPRYKGSEPIRLFLGSPTGPIAPAIWSTPPLWGSGHTAVGVGDVDGDGLGDLAFGGNQRLWMVTGAEILGPVASDTGETGDTGTPANPGDTGDTGTPTATEPTGDTGPDDAGTTPTEPGPGSYGGGGCGCQASSVEPSGWFLSRRR